VEIPADMGLVIVTNPNGTVMQDTHTALPGWQMAGILAAAILLAGPTGQAGAASRLSEPVVAGIEHAYGDLALRRIEKWQAMIGSAGSMQERGKLEAVNNFFNAMRFVSDAELWGKEDYWATPLETLLANGGDCEDFSIAKYFTLRKMGIAQEKLRLTYVKAIDLNQAHMVLTYFSSPAADPLVLDNLDKTIKPVSQRHDLLPVYSFNASGLWLARSHGVEQHIGSSKRLSQWSAVIDRIGHEQLALR
jgi:predicted transglutaminase-like cysteine proteinase